MTDPARCYQNRGVVSALTLMVHVSLMVDLYGVPRKDKDDTEEEDKLYVSGTLVLPFLGLACIQVLLDHAMEMWPHAMGIAWPPLGPQIWTAGW